jgi:gluconate 2-dehydrogenase gamma chain
VASAIPIASGLASLPRAGRADVSEALPPSANGSPTASPSNVATRPTSYLSLGPAEAAFVEALVNVMCPADELTPNGVDCGLAQFIDGQLAGAFGKGERLYLRGPWRRGKPQLGYQLPMTPEQFFKEGIAAANAVSRTRFGETFDRLAPRDADALLRDIAGEKAPEPRFPLSTWFTSLVYPLFVQACFSDPEYGGNRDKVFWRMVGYPGLPANHRRDMVELRGKPVPAARDPKSIDDFS